MIRRTSPAAATGVACAFAALLSACTESRGGSPTPTGNASSAPSNVRGDGSTDGPNFRFSVGDTHVDAASLSPEDVTRLEARYAALLAPLQGLPGLLPETIAVVYDRCGTANAFHDAASATITMCHELADAANAVFTETIGDASDAAEQVTLLVESAMAFVLYHEIGHALDAQLELPIVGNVESAVDAIATVIAVETANPIFAAGGAGLFADTPPSLAGRHGGGLDRSGDILCWAVGGDPVVRAVFDLPDIEDVFATSGRDCAAEYAEQRNTVRSWVPGLARLSGVDGAGGEGATGPFELRFGARWLASGGQQLAARERVGQAFARALVPLNAATPALAGPVSVVYDACDAAYADHDAAERTLTVCEQLLAHVYDIALDTSGDTTEDRTTSLQRAYDSVSYLTYHQVGHVLHDLGAISADIDVERAADAIASVLLVEGGRSLSALDAGLFVYSQPPAHRAIHGVGLSRADDLLCWAFGGDEVLHTNPHLVDLASGYVGGERDCVAEYARIRDAVRGWLAAAAGR